MSRRYVREEVKFGEQAELEFTFKRLHEAFLFASSVDRRLESARGMVELLRSLPDITAEVEVTLRSELSIAEEEFNSSLTEDERLILIDEEYREIVLSPAQRERLLASIREKQEEALAWAYYRTAIKVAYAHGLLIRTYVPMKVEVPEIYKKLVAKIDKK